MSEKLIVELNNIYLRSDRGGSIFHDLNFKLVAGRSAIIVGGAGSGKSSLVELLTGLRFTDQGSVSMFGELLKGSRVRKTRSRIGGVGGVFELIESFTVTENILFPLVLRAEKKSVRRERLTKLLSEFSLLKQSGEYPQNLTRVEKTLVQFARASIANQPLIIVDEPAAGLDQKTARQVFEHLIKVSLSGRSLIILASEIPTHKIPDTDTYHLENGQLV